MTRPPPRPTLFPYTTLFRSRGSANNTLTVDGRKITSPFRQETISIRGIVPGEYVVNVHYFLATRGGPVPTRSEEHTSELQSRGHLVCRLLLEKKKNDMKIVP